MSRVTVRESPSSPMTDAREREHERNKELTGSCYRGRGG